MQLHLTAWYCLTTGNIEVQDLSGWIMDVQLLKKQAIHVVVCAILGLRDLKFLLK